MSLDQPEPLRREPIGCRVESTTRSIQQEHVNWVSLNPDWLRELGLDEQGAGTIHALTHRPVVVEGPAIIIRPAEVR